MCIRDSYDNADKIVDHAFSTYNIETIRSFMGGTEAWYNAVVSVVMEWVDECDEEIEKICRLIRREVKEGGGLV